MSKQKPFSDLRWNQPLGGETVGEREFTEEEKQKHKEKLRNHLKRIGVVKSDDEFKDI